MESAADSFEKRWQELWADLRLAISAQPRCAEHPSLPCLLTLGQGVVNDILRVDRDGVTVRSHRTKREDRLPASSFRAWWAHLEQHGSASLEPNDPNCPRSDRARLVGAVLARCLSDRIHVEGKHIKLVAAQPQHGRQLADELQANEPLIEGASRRVIVNAYERNPEARRQCIALRGDRCCICNFSFGEFFVGPAAEGHVHVHHLRPLSKIGESYVINPATDLCPVCPNCHAAIHRRTPPYTVDEVRAMLRQKPGG